MLKTTTLKFFTFITKFVLLPSPMFFGLYLDIFNLDIFGKKQIADLNAKIRILEEANSIKNEILQENTQLIRQTKADTYDLSKVLLYTAGLLVTGISIYLIISYFSDSGSGAAAQLLANQANNNSKEIVSNIATQHKITQGVISSISSNIISTNKDLNIEAISALTGAIKVASTSINQVNSNLIQENSTFLNSSISMLNENISLYNNNLINYLYENVATKITIIDSKVQKVVEILNMPSTEVKSPAFSGEGTVSVTVPPLDLESSPNTGGLGLTLKPEDIIIIKK